MWVSPPRLSVQRAALLPRKGRPEARPKILRSEAVAPREGHLRLVFASSLGNGWGQEAGRKASPSGPRRPSHSQCALGWTKQLFRARGLSSQPRMPTCMPAWPAEDSPGRLRTGVRLHRGSGALNSGCSAASGGAAGPGCLGRGCCRQDGGRDFVGCIEAWLGLT